MKSRIDHTATLLLIMTLLIFSAFAVGYVVGVNVERGNAHAKALDEQSVSR